MSFNKATRATIAPKIAIQGPSGAGKTYSALLFARGLVGPSGKIAVIDTENGSASLYANLTDFDVCDVRPKPFGTGLNKTSAFWWTDFRDAINDAIAARYDALIIDSASHIWQATLDYKTRLDSNGSNSFTNWGLAGQTFATVQNLILQSEIPVVCAFRVKTEYILETNEKGKTTPRKVGLAPVSRGDTEFDFTLVFDVSRDHRATISKTRCNLFDDDFCEQITPKTGETFRKWLGDLND